MKPLILASASLTRAQLLAAAGVFFDVLPANLDEAVLRQEWAAEDITTVASRLATEKARSVAALRPGVCILGADQILSLDGMIISKCRTREEASLLLCKLRGRTHELITAAALVVDGVCFWDRVEICRMTMRDFSDDFLEDYLAQAGPVLVESVGCYAFEGFGAQLFDRVEGEFFSILGLPLMPLLAALRDHDVIVR